MPASARLNKYTVAAGLGVAAGTVYLYQAYVTLGDFKFPDGGAVAAGIFGVAVCAAVIWDITAPNVNLGILHDEKSSLIPALILTAYLSAGLVGSQFQILSAASRQNATKWILGTWTWGTSDSNCSPHITIERGNNDALTFILSSERHTRQVIDATPDRVITTDKGAYTLHPGGEMTTTEPGYERARLRRCPE